MSRVRWYGLARTGCRSSARRSRSTTCRCRARTARARRRPATPPTGPARRAAGERRDDGVPSRSDGAHADASASGVKPSAPLASRRPHVGVAEVVQLLDPLALRRAAGRRRTGWSCRSAASVASSRAVSPVERRPGSRSSGRPARGRWRDWLAVASSVPSSAHRCTRPWPKPLATAWTRMSSSTHSVGTSAPTRSVLSRLLPPASLPERLADAERHVVAEDRERRRPTCSSTSGMRAHSAERPSPGAPSRSSESRPSASRMSRRCMIESSTCHAVRSRGGQSSGGGTSGSAAHWPLGVDVAVRRARR